MPVHTSKYTHVLRTQRVWVTRSIFNAQSYSGINEGDDSDEGTLLVWQEQKNDPTWCFSRSVLVWYGWQWQGGMMAHLHACTLCIVNMYVRVII